MKGVTKGLVRHRILVIILCVALVVPSVLGMVRTKTKYDLLYYLPQDLETVRGQEILLKDFGKGAFSLLVTEGMSLKEIAYVTESIPTTIASKLSRTRKKLCKIIKMLQS